MATFQSFDEHYQPQIQTTLSHIVDFIEEIVSEIQCTRSATEVEKLLDQACQQCLYKIQTQINDIKVAVKKKGVDCKSSVDKQRYKSFVEGVAAGIRSAQGLFDTVFTRIREIIKTIIDWIQRDVPWVKSAINEAFNAIRHLINVSQSSR